MSQVILVFRKPYSNAFSIEYLFNTLYTEMKEKKDIRKHELPYSTNGAKSLLFNISSLLKFKGGIVHITGDTYYSILGAVYCKRIMTVHDLSFLNRTKGLKRSLLRFFWVTMPSKFSHKITVVSQATKEALLKETNIDPSKVHVIYNFIDPIFKPVKRNFNGKIPRILQIGTNFNKNVENLVKALNCVECTLIIIGVLSEEQKQILASSGINYINKFSLSISDLYQEYVKADMLTFVSTVEGFGLPILEAQATGLPVITSNCSSMPEVAGGGALLVNPFEPQSIKNGIIEIINNKDKRACLVEKGYINVERFSKEKIASDYLKLYEDL
jgi:glycosyltransferase involved in cell wall biosynthesis